jgi:hypothetical protein
MSNIFNCSSINHLFSYFPHKNFSAENKNSHDNALSEEEKIDKEFEELMTEDQFDIHISFKEINIIQPKPELTKSHHHARSTKDPFSPVNNIYKSMEIKLDPAQLAMHNWMQNENDSNCSTKSDAGNNNTTYGNNSPSIDKPDETTLQIDDSDSQQAGPSDDDQTD